MQTLELLEGCIDRVIREIPHDEGREMARYALFPGGKRIRPRVLFATYEAIGLSLDDDALLLASLIEILHSASLVHDDLPALDNDLIRRGKEASHVKFGEGEALLLGDLLQSIVFEGIHLLSNRELKAVTAITLGQSNGRLVLGQLEDIKNQDDIKKLRSIHELKTGALFSAACYLPTFSSTELSESEQNMYRDLGLEYGVLFQFANDLKDIEEINETGRDPGSDARNGRLSLTDDDVHQPLQQEIKDTIETLQSLLAKVAVVHQRLGTDGQTLDSIVQKLVTEVTVLLDKYFSSSSSEQSPEDSIAQD